jgi:hypothetical protein
MLKVEIGAPVDTEERANALQFINSLLALPDDGPEHALRFRSLVAESRESASKRSLVLAIYKVAAAGVWETSTEDLSTLVYSPLDNTSIIPAIREDVQTILKPYGESSGFARGWRYVETFAADAPRPKPAHGEFALTAEGGR